MKIYEGDLVNRDFTFAVAVGRFNQFITGKLLEGALDTFRRHAVAPESIEVAWAPGSFELPLVAKRLAASKKYDAVVVLACVIRGGTDHYEYVASEVAKGVGQVGLETGVPTIFGVITAGTLEQAIERAGTKAGNKGADAAQAALEMANLMKNLPGK